MQHTEKRTTEEISLFWLATILAEQHLEEPALAWLIQVNLFGPFEFDGWLIDASQQSKHVKINAYDSLQKTMAYLLLTLKERTGWMLTIVHDSAPVLSSRTYEFLIPSFSMYLPDTAYKHSFGLSCTQYQQPFRQLLRDCIEDPSSCRKTPTTDTPIYGDAYGGNLRFE